MVLMGEIRVNVDFLERILLASSADTCLCFSILSMPTFFQLWDFTFHEISMKYYPPLQIFYILKFTCIPRTQYPSFVFDLSFTYHILLLLFFPTMPPSLLNLLCHFDDKVQFLCLCSYATIPRLITESQFSKCTFLWSPYNPIESSIESSQEN